MSEDPQLAQARLLLAAMHQQVVEISRELEALERRDESASIRGGQHDRRQEASLRRDLYEAHRLIVGLHRRFPSTAAARSAVSQWRPSLGRE